MKFFVALTCFSIACLAAASPVAEPSNEVRALLFNPDTLEAREVMVNRYTLKTRLTDGSLDTVLKRSPQVINKCPEADNCACGGRKDTFP